MSTGQVTLGFPESVMTGELEPLGVFGCIGAQEEHEDCPEGYKGCQCPEGEAVDSATCEGFCVSALGTSASEYTLPAGYHTLVWEYVNGGWWLKIDGLKTAVDTQENVPETAQWIENRTEEEESANEPAALSLGSRYIWYFEESEASTREFDFSGTVQEGDRLELRTIGNVSMTININLADDQPGWYRVGASGDYETSIVTLEAGTHHLVWEYSGGIWWLKVN